VPTCKQIRLRRRSSNSTLGVGKISTQPEKFSTPLPLSSHLIRKRSSISFHRSPLIALRAISYFKSCAKSENGQDRRDGTAIQHWRVEAISIRPREISTGNDAGTANQFIFSWIIRLVSGWQSACFCRNGGNAMRRMTQRDQAILRAAKRLGYVSRDQIQRYLFRCSLHPYWCTCSNRGKTAVNRARMRRRPTHRCSRRGSPVSHGLGRGL